MENLISCFEIKARQMVRYSVAFILEFCVSCTESVVVAVVTIVAVVVLVIITS